MPSNVIRSFVYLSETSVLRITFNTGNVYDYLDVPESVYNDMKASFSKGIYFNQFVKNVFKTVRVE